MDWRFLKAYIKFVVPFIKFFGISFDKRITFKNQITYGRQKVYNIMMINIIICP